MSVFRILFLGTPEFSNEALKALMHDEHFQVVGIVTQPDRPVGRKMIVTPSPVKAFAQNEKALSGVPVFTPEKINTPSVIEDLRKLQADSAVVIAYGQILGPEFLDLFPLKSVNLHVSLLPKFRGAAPIQRAIEAGETETGVALQVIVQKLDAGPLIGIRRIPIGPDTTSKNVFAAMGPLCQDLLKQDFADYLRGFLSPQPQDERLATIAKKVKKDEGLIRWQDSSEKIYNRYRAFFQWPGVWTIFQGKQLKLTGMNRGPNGGGARGASSTIAAEIGSSAAAEAGQIIEIEETSLTVQCGQGTVQVFEVQPESRAKMSVKDFIQGYRLKKGDVFGV